MDEDVFDNDRFPRTCSRIKGRVSAIRLWIQKGSFFRGGTGLLGATAAVRVEPFVIVAVVVVVNNQSRLSLNGIERRLG